MNWPVSIVISLLISISIKPLYYVQLTTIKFLTGKKIRSGFFEYDRIQITTAVLMFFFITLLLKYGGLTLGILAGGCGVAHLCVIHMKFFRSLY